MPYSCIGRAFAQEAPSPAGSKPTEHVLGTITAVDPAQQSITVKVDGSSASRLVQLAGAKTLLKVAPGAKDIKSAVRITAQDLAVGDRVDVRGFPATAAPGSVAARSLILMSSRELQAAHQAESDAWRHATAGIVTAVDPSSGQIQATTRGAAGPQPLTVDARNAQFLRYSPENPQSPQSSQLAEIQPGDQIRVLGDHSAGPDTITAQKIYSGAFKTVAATVASVSPDGHSFTVKDLATKSVVRFSLGSATAVHRLPAPVAMALARRFNPSLKDAPGTTPPAPALSPSPDGARPRPAPGSSESFPPPAAGSADGPSRSGSGEAPPEARRRMGAGNGDLGQMLDRLPAIAITDLKPGDAVIVSGSPYKSGSDLLLATAVIAGVEPIFQSATPRQAQSLGDWSNAMGLGAAAGETGGPQ